MADEELHETDSNNQKDWQSETSSSTVADETASKATEQNAEFFTADFFFVFFENGAGAGRAQRHCR